MKILKNYYLNKKEEGLDFFVQDSNEVVIGFINNDYEDDTIYFIPTLKDKWWGTSLSEHIRPVLDLDGELSKELYDSAFDGGLWFPQESD